MKNQGLLSSYIGLASCMLVSCVTTGTHVAALQNESEKQAALQSELDDFMQDLEVTKKRLQEAISQHDTQNTESDEKLSKALSQNQQLITKLESMGSNVEKLLGEKDTLAAEREKLESEVAKLRQMRKLTEARNAEYKDLLRKLHKMIDAGSLEVKIRNGRMLVAMSSDVLFPPGKAALKKAAVASLRELASTLMEFPDRKFQVVGHSDSTPIHTSRFPSNWELSSQRAIEVVKVLVDAGVPPEMLSAAGASSHDPLLVKVTPAHNAKALDKNRRVELVFVPRIDRLPGFEEILKNH
jgi:chemotaxis protein MotB